MHVSPSVPQNVVAAPSGGITYHCGTLTYTKIGLIVRYSQWNYELPADRIIVPDVQDLITDIFPFEDAAVAFNRFACGQTGKVLLKYKDSDNI